jgi:hypothetical protein
MEGSEWGWRVGADVADCAARVADVKRGKRGTTGVGHGPEIGYITNVQTAHLKKESHEFPST